MAKLYFTYAAMNAGKSTVLLQSAFNYVERGMEVLLFTAAIDDRAGKGKIASRIGLSREAILFDENTRLDEVVRGHHEKKPLSCIFIDEAQFLTKAHILQLAVLADEDDLPVMCYGLRTDFKGHLFEGSQWLMALGDVLREMKSICHCGKKATMNLRIDAQGEPVIDGDTVEVGGNERYIPLCRRHFFQKLGRQNI